MDSLSSELPIAGGSFDLRLLNEQPPERPNVIVMVGLVRLWIAETTHIRCPDDIGAGCRAG